MKNRIFLDVYAVSARYGVSRSTILRWVGDAKMPSPRRAPGGYGWPLDVLEEWETEVKKVAERDRQEANYER